MGQFGAKFRGKRVTAVSQILTWSGWHGETDNANQSKFHCAYLLTLRHGAVTHM